LRAACLEKAFYYHFLDLQTGARAWQCELSTIDSALLLGGMLTAAAYFGGDAPAEREIRDLADRLYARVDWRWAQNDGATVTHGWRPEAGFLPYRWEGYDEALLLYVLGLGSPTHPLSQESYRAWASTYQWKTVYEIQFLCAGPLFTHQLSHVWIDFRGIQDAFMREHGIDYFKRPSVRFQGDVQSDLPRWQGCPVRVGVAVALRHQRGADRRDDREPPIGTGVASDTRMSAHRRRTAGRRIHRRVAVE
jgi:hypothetical protein